MPTPLSELDKLLRLADLRSHTVVRHDGNSIHVAPESIIEGPLGYKPDDKVGVLRFLLRNAVGGKVLSDQCYEVTNKFTQEKVFLLFRDQTVTVCRAI